MEDPARKQWAIIKVLYYPQVSEMIEINVELNSIPIDDGVGKDVTVNWFMYDSFDANKTFWTDSNGL
jgi:hypothetical protein